MIGFVFVEKKIEKMQIINSQCVFPLILNVVKLLGKNEIFVDLNFDTRNR